MTLLLTVLVGGAIGAIVTPAAVWFGIWYRRRRTAALAAEASRLGFRFSPYGSRRTSAPQSWPAGFHLLDRKQAATANVLSGTLGTVAIKAFDFSYHTANDKSRDLSCALAVLPASGPNVTLEPETAATKVLAIIGRKDVQLDDPEFDRVFRVTSDDPAGVAGFLVPELRRWLMAQGLRDMSFEVRGCTVLACGTQRRPKDIESLLGVVGSFAQLVAPHPLTAAQEAAAADAHAMIGALTLAPELSVAATLQLSAVIGAILGVALVLFGALTQRFPM